MLRITTALAAFPARADQDSIDKLEKGMPAAVVRFIDRRVGCNYWQSEAGTSDKARNAEIARKLRSLNCKAIDRDEQALARRYRAHPNIIEVRHAAGSEMPD